MSIYNNYLHGSLNPKNIISLFRHRVKFRKEHPSYFNPEGLIVFCGPQGSGKTLSAVQMIEQMTFDYPKAWLCTNTELKNINMFTKVIPYEGLKSLTELENGEHGVIYFIDEIHLEFNSLESKNVPIEVMIEVSQQRKQRKTIVGTSQVYMRMAKPLREQIKNAVICKNFFKCIQFNKLVDGENTREENGKLICDTVKRFIWFHTPKLYDSYDTYAKMKRYRNEWKGVPRQDLYGGGHNDRL